MVKYFHLKKFFKEIIKEVLNDIVVRFGLYTTQQHVRYNINVISFYLEQVHPIKSLKNSQQFRFLNELVFFKLSIWLLFCLIVISKLDKPFHWITRCKQLVPSFYISDSSNTRIFRNKLSIPFTSAQRALSMC